MNFSCGDRPSAASMTKIDKFWISFHRFVDICQNLGVGGRSDGETSDFDRNSDQYLVEVPVVDERDDHDPLQ